MFSSPRTSACAEVFGSHRPGHPGFPFPRGVPGVRHDPVGSLRPGAVATRARTRADRPCRNALDDDSERHAAVRVLEQCVLSEEDVVDEIVRFDARKPKGNHVPGKVRHGLGLGNRVEQNLRRRSTRAQPACETAGSGSIRRR